MILHKNFKKIISIPEGSKTIPTSETEKKFYLAVYTGKIKGAQKTLCTDVVASNALLYALESIIKDKEPVELTRALDIIIHLASIKGARAQKCNGSIKTRDINQEIALVVQKFVSNIQTAILEKIKKMQALLFIAHMRLIMH